MLYFVYFYPWWCWWCGHNWCSDILSKWYFLEGWILRNMKCSSFPGSRVNWILGLTLCLEAIWDSFTLSILLTNIHLTCSSDQIINERSLILQQSPAFSSISCCSWIYQRAVCFSLLILQPPHGVKSELNEEDLTFIWGGGGDVITII